MDINKDVSDFAQLHETNSHSVPRPNIPLAVLCSISPVIILVSLKYKAVD